MLKVTRSQLLRYGVAVLVTALALLLTVLLKLWDTWLLFLAAVIISTSYGGPWPGLLTTFLTALASAYCFLPPSIKATSVDLTERKQAEEALRESEERLQAILDNSPAVVYVKDTQGRYILVNRQSENMVRLTKEQIIGKTDYDMYPKEIADAFRANDLRVLESRTALESEEVALLAFNRNQTHTVERIALAMMFSVGDEQGRSILIPMVKVFYTHDFF